MRYNVRQIKRCGQLFASSFRLFLQPLMRLASNVRFNVVKHICAVEQVHLDAVSVCSTKKLFNLRAKARVTADFIVLRWSVCNCCCHQNGPISIFSLQPQQLSYRTETNLACISWNCRYQDYHNFKSASVWHSCLWPSIRKRRTHQRFIRIVHTN